VCKYIVSLILYTNKHQLVLSNASKYCWQDNEKAFLLLVNTQSAIVKLIDRLAWLPNGIVSFRNTNAPLITFDTVLFRYQVPYLFARHVLLLFIHSTNVLMILVYFGFTSWLMYLFLSQQSSCMLTWISGMNINKMRHNHRSVVKVSKYSHTSANVLIIFTFLNFNTIFYMTGLWIVSKVVLTWSLKPTLKWKKCY